MASFEERLAEARQAVAAQLIEVDEEALPDAETGEEFIHYVWSAGDRFGTVEDGIVYETINGQAVRPARREIHG